MRPYFYLMDEDGNISSTEDRDSWGEWFQTADRRIAFDQVGLAEVSTVFLGLDHNFWFEGAPILFETLVFAPGRDGERVGAENSMRRYETKEQAIAGHEQVVMFLKGLPGQLPKPKGVGLVPG